MVGEGELHGQLGSVSPFGSNINVSASHPRLQVTLEVQLNLALERHQVFESEATQAAEQFLSVLSFLEPGFESTALH